MVRQIIHIDEEKCNGCGICATACHEGAIDIVDGKAKLTREHFCDGFGDCLPECPTGAISFEDREAPAYDEAAVEAAKQEREAARKSQQNLSIDDMDGEDAFRQAMALSFVSGVPGARPTGCPGSMLRNLEAERAGRGQNVSNRQEETPSSAASYIPSELNNWPVQIKLLPERAPFYQGAHLLIAADCTAYAYGNFHQKFVKDHVVLIGCPKLDDVDYTDKLMHIIRDNNIQSISLVRMQVPCCGGLQRAAEMALRESGKDMPLTITIVTPDGHLL